MTSPSPRRRRGTRRQPVLRHHLEDAFDRELDRLHGSGRSRRRDRARRTRRYEERAARLVASILEFELEDERLEGLRLLDLTLHPVGALLTVRLTAAEDVPRDALDALATRLRAELCRHLPRRHTPEVRLDLEPGGGR